MKIHIHHQNANDGEVFAMGLYGPKTDAHMAELISADMELI